MPRIFSPVDMQSLDKEIQRDYFDRHTPHIICDSVAVAGEKFMIKVKIGEEYMHPNDADHYISFVQLWNRETFLAEIHFTPGALGNKPNQVEVDFFIVPQVSMNLQVLSNCTKHGLWMSEVKDIKVNQPQATV
jgi:superoxide reductase